MSGLFLGDTASKLYVGDTAASKVYVGDTLAWSTVTKPVVVGYDNGAASDMAFPAHQVGDLLIVAAYRMGNVTSPTKPSSSSTVPTWIDIDNNSGANTNVMRTAMAYATVTNHTTGAWTNANRIEIIVVRGAKSSSPIGMHSEAGGLGTVPILPSGTLTNTDGTSLVLGIYGTRAINTPGWDAAPSGWTRQDSVYTTANTGIVFNTKDDTTSYSAASQGTTTSTGYRAAVIEILQH